MDSRYGDYADCNVADGVYSCSCENVQDNCSSYAPSAYNASRPAAADACNRSNGCMWDTPTSACEPCAWPPEEEFGGRTQFPYRRNHTPSQRAAASSPLQSTAFVFRAVGYDEGVPSPSQTQTQSLARRPYGCPNITDHEECVHGYHKCAWDSAAAACRLPPGPAPVCNRSRVGMLDVRSTQWGRHQHHGRVSARAPRIRFAAPS